MTSILDRLNSEDETGRIEQLETELESVRNAFEEYVSTTEGLEVEVKKELHEMQTKLNQSNSAKEKLEKKMWTMETLVKTLELSEKGIRENLRTESKRRRQAEKDLTETQLELRSKTVKLRHLERNDSSALRIVDSGVITEMVNNTTKNFTDRELEAVTHELLTTQETLLKTEEQLHRSQALVQDLERSLQNFDDGTAQSLSGDDKELLRELDEIRAEIDAGRSNVESHSTSSGTQQSKEQIFKYESQLKESRDENLRLAEEIACLRNILYDQGESRTGVDEKVQKSGGIKMVDELKELHLVEVESLRKQIEGTLNENMALQEKLRKLDMLNPTKKPYNDDKKGEGDANPGETDDVTEDEIVGVKFANDFDADEKLRQTEMMLKKSQEECSEMRTEILALTESLYNAMHGRGEDEVSAAEIINLTSSGIQDLRRARIEIEDNKREITALEDNLMTSQEEVRVLSEEISFMSSAFEKAQEEYNSVVEELRQTENALAAAKDTKFTQSSKMKKLESVAEKTPEKDAELKVLKSQFKKLSKKSKNLAKQVKGVESEVLSVRQKQDKANEETKARVAIAKKLQNDIVQTVSETNQRNREVEELAFMMENRMGTTERNMEVLDGEIAVAMKTLQSTQTASPDNKSKQLASVVLQSGDASIDSQSNEIDSRTNGIEEEEKITNKIEDKEEVTSDESNSSMSVFERTRRLFDVSETIQKLVNVSKHGKSSRVDQQNEDDPTTVTAASVSTDANSKYEEIIKRVANYEALSREKRELETQEHVDIEVRE